MIYRFKSAYKAFKGGCIRGTTEPDRTLKNRNWEHGRFGGAWSEGCLSVGELNMPKGVTNKKARFYFTEKGYKKFGKSIIESAIKEKQILQVIKRKNPKKSQIVYEDEYQVAILPEKKR